MQNTKLIKLLKTFSSSEIREFKDFVCSPVFNKNKKIITLFDAVKEFYPEFCNNKLKEEFIYKKIFPDDKYDYYKFKNIISDLLSLGKEFLSFIHYKKFSSLNEKFLLEQLRDRNLDSIFEQTYKVYKKQLDSIVVKDDNYLLKCLELTEEMHSFRIPKDPASRFGFFQKELDYFLKFSIIRLLRYYNVMIHEKAQNNYEYNLSMIDEILDYLNKNKNEDNSTILIYYNILLLSKTNDEKIFFELKKLKEKYIDELNTADIYMVYLYMSSYCAYIYNNLCRTDFMYEHFLITKENYDRGTIVLGKILYPDFLNHVKIAVRVNEFDWAEKYIERFKDLLTEEKESTLNFCYAFINYKKGNLDKAMDLLSQTNFPNFIIKIQVKILLLQIYYEKEFYEQALAMIDTFRHYLNREKSILENFKESFYDYLRITNELIKVRTDLNKNEKGFKLKEIAGEIEKIKFNQFGIKNWLKERSLDFRF